MTRMLRAGRVVLPAVLCALLLAAQVSGENQVPTDLYWLGPYFAGMRLTGSPESPWDRTFSYGDCELPEGEGGCSVPAQVQNTTSCARNPIGLDRLPYEVYLLRGGGLAAVYEPTAVDVGTGDQTVTMYADFELMSAALRDMHRQSQPGPQPLAPPVYPMPVLRELKRVTAVADRFDSVGKIAEATELTPPEVRLRLRIAELLGPDALEGVPAPTMSVVTVERLRQLAFRTQYDPVRGARRLGMSVATLRKKLRRVRGLTGYC